MTTKKIITILALISLFYPLKVFSQEEINNARFSDVPDDNAASTAINYLYDKQIIKGKEDGLFHPEDNITRVEALKILFDLKDIILQKNLPINKFFPDIDNEKWYAPYVFMAKTKKTMSGTEDGMFEPDRNITRAESCKIVLRTYGVRTEFISSAFKKLHHYTDIDNDAWYAKCIGFSSFYNLYETGTENFEPDKYISRQDFAYFVYKMDEFYRSGNMDIINPTGTVISDEAQKEKESTDDNTIEIPEEYRVKLAKVMTGIASYYSDWFNGKNTASGATFDNSKMMAAHPLLPFNTILKVTNHETGESTEVEVLDCGPFVKDRILDLSSAAFDEIHHLGSGLVNVDLEIIKLGEGKWQDKCYELTQAKW